MGTLGSPSSNPNPCPCPAWPSTTQLTVCSRSGDLFRSFAFVVGASDGFPNEHVYLLVPRTSEYIWLCGQIKGADGMKVVH